MGTHHNDNEKLSFITLLAATKNVTRYLNPDEKQNEESKGEPASGDGEKQKREANRQYVEHRLDELAAWERRISGRK